MIRVTVWNENVHEKTHESIARLYPHGMHGAIAQGIASDTLSVRTATLDEPDHGLTDAALAETDVLVWWGHAAHDRVDDAIVERVRKRVLEGMGLVVLHSGHYSKIFRRLMGTTCALKWREANEKERIWTVDPSHAIADGVPEQFVLPHEEMYGEFFDIPAPDELVFVSWFAGGEVFRSGCTFRRGQGKIFYFRPGHESFPTYHDANVLRVIANACRWCGTGRGAAPIQGNTQPLEPLGG